MSRPNVWLIAPSIHREGGTERCVAEELERRARRFNLRVYSTEVGEDLNQSEGNVRRIPRLSGQHAVLFAWWVETNAILGAWDARRTGRPHAVVFPGVSVFDADVIGVPGVHMVVSTYWDRVCNGLWRDLTERTRRLRAAHWPIFTNLARALEGFTHRWSALLWCNSAKGQWELESRNGRPTGTVARVPYEVDVIAFEPSRRLAERSQARRAHGLVDECVLLLVGNDAWKKGTDVAVGALAVLPGGTVLAAGGPIDGAEVRQVRSRSDPLVHAADPCKYYAATDVLVASSREDSSHLPAIEAIATGLPWS